jgi:hypothetical protein
LTGDCRFGQGGFDGKATSGAPDVGIDIAGLPCEQNTMKSINFAVTVEELRLLASLASDQLFRRQFIDPRMPGYKGSPEEVNLGKTLVVRMRLIIDETQQVTAPLAQSRPSRGPRNI